MGSKPCLIKLSAYSSPLQDDRAAKNAALSLGVPVRGTLGVLLLAKQESKLPQIKPVLNQLIQVGFRVSPEVLSAVLQLANECD
jgi:predicted nucleic acid-binding protein